MILAEPGGTIALSLYLESRLTTRFPRAYLHTAAGTFITSYDLVAVGGRDGLYNFATTAPVLTGRYILLYEVFTDAGRTILSTSDAGHDDVLVVVTASATAANIWDEILTAHTTTNSAADYLRVAMQTGGQSNIRIDNMVYDVNGFLLSARVRMFPSALIAAASTVGGTGEGETHTIVLAGLPDGTFVTHPTTVLGTR